MSGENSGCAEREKRTSSSDLLITEHTAKKKNNRVNKDSSVVRIS